MRRIGGEGRRPTGHATSSGDETLVRPHRLRVTAGGPHTVTRVEFLGSCHRYSIRTGTGTTLVADLGPDEPLSVGSPCDVVVVGRTGSAHSHIDPTAKKDHGAPALPLAPMPPPIVIPIPAAPPTLPPLPP